MSEFMDEAKKLAGEHSDVADKGLDQAEQLAEQKTGGKFDSEIQAGEQQAERVPGHGRSGQPERKSVYVRCTSRAPDSGALDCLAIPALDLALHNKQRHDRRRRARPAPSPVACPGSLVDRVG